MRCAVALLALLSACSERVVLPCGPSTCTGCCRDDGQCLLVETESACGVGGRTCRTCAAGETCEGGGICVSHGSGLACDANSCPNGCCVESMCIPFSAQTGTHCGMGGQQCAACAAGVCTNGVCGPLSCTMACPGCCSGNTCFPFNTQSQSLCGSGGQTCFACAAGPCLNGACTGAGCNASSCPGCCAGNICIPTSAQSNSNCGNGGSFCGACMPNTTCMGGQCVLGPPPAPGIGTPCVMNTDCLPGDTCKRFTADMMTPYPGGYCTHGCNAAVGCDGGVCVMFPNQWETTPLCLATCPGLESQSTCRAGYFCYDVAMGPPGLCWLANPPPLDAGVPSDKVGLPCTSASQCSNPPDPTVALCLSADAGYPLGYCSADCGAAGPGVCGSGSACLSAPGVAGARCYATCPMPLAGQSTCRTGYVCTGAMGIIDGFCDRDCRNPGATCPMPTMCGPMGYCM